MRTVVTVSLNGNAYQMEEGAYQALRAYLDDAQAKLREDPGCAEILSDLEQAIADKCDRCLNEHKNVVGTEELQRILAQMGPVDSGAQPQPDRPGVGAGGDRAAGSPGAHGSTGADSGAPKRLYQIREGAIISGLCNGIAAYLGVDVVMVRIVFVLLAVVSWGTWILVYIALMFVIPFASTSEEQAAARGLPFTAQLLVEQAKKQYESFKQGSGWRNHWRREARRQRRQWRADWRRERAAMHARHHWYWRPPPPPSPHPGDTDYAAQVLGGVLNPIAALGHAVLLIALLIAILQLVTRGMVFGWVPPPGLPLWAGIVILVVIYQVVATPLRLMRHAAFYVQGGHGNPWIALWGSIVWLTFMAVFFWFAYQHWSDVQHLLRELTDSIRLRYAHPPGRAIDWIVGGDR